MRVRALPAGDAAVLLELSEPAEPAEPGPGGPAAAAGLAAAIVAARLPGVLEVIPGARTVLVSVEPGSWDRAALAARLLEVPVPARPPVAADPVTQIDVCYDGPDLAEVAELTGLTVSDVIARHAAAEYRVAWLGFAPGFGYLSGLDPVLARVPRRDSPRVSVAAGSVAIAGGFAAVYPASSPGGWRLLGRTDARLWDTGREPPALLAPGMRVRFVAVPDLPGSETPPARTSAARTGPASPTSPARTGPARTSPASRISPARTSPARTAEVLRPGPLTTVQDLGRPGLGHLGVPGSGAADPASLRRANALAGNEPDAAGLEVTLGGLALRFDADAVGAITGAPAPVLVTSPDGAVTEPGPGSAFAIPAGAVVRLRAPGFGLRSYLAVDGGIDVHPVLGSRSADRLSGLGPAPLQAGDNLPLGTPRASEQARTLGRGWAPTALSGAAGAQPRPSEASQADAGEPYSGGDVTLRTTAGPRADWFTPAALATLAGASYQVTAASNRTGLRLDGPRLGRVSAAELPSEGIATGSLQVSHDGLPILLLADHPTTGGYPVIAVVHAADVGRAAQLRPGQRVRFALDR